MSGKFTDHIASLIDARNRSWSTRIEGIQPLVDVVTDMQKGGYDADLVLVRPVEAGGLITGTLTVPVFHTQVDSSTPTHVMEKGKKYDVALEQGGRITLTAPGDEAPCLDMNISSRDDAEKMAFHVFDGAARNFERTTDSSLNNRTVTL